MFGASLANRARSCQSFPRVRRTRVRFRVWARGGTYGSRSESLRDATLRAGEFTSSCAVRSEWWYTETVARLHQAHAVLRRFCGMCHGYETGPTSARSFRA